MRTLPLVLLAVAALVAPTAALAGGSATPAARYFVITGMVLGDQKAEASGKLAIEGSKLAASVGCNMIGGTVSVDGDTVTISEPLAMTEMACPGTNGDLEAMLLKILQRGPFTISSGAWSGNGAALLVEELAAGHPGANATAPDEPADSSPGAVITDPGFSCPPYPIASGAPGAIDGTVQPDGSPVSGGGSGSSDGSGTTNGSTGGGGAPAAGTDGSSSSGSGPTSTTVSSPGATATAGEEPPAPPVATDPAPSFDLGQKGPEPSLVIVAPATPTIVEPAPSAIAVPDPGTVTDPGATYDPDPGFNGKPVPVDPCFERMYAVDQGNGVGGVGLYPPKAADAAAEHAASTSNPNAPFVALGLALLTLAAVAVGTLRRRQAPRLAPEPAPEPRPGATPR